MMNLNKFFKNQNSIDAKFICNNNLPQTTNLVAEE